VRPSGLGLSHHVRFLAIVAAGLLVLLTPAAARQSAQTKPAFAIKITSPTGRTGVSGGVRIVARITVPDGVTLGPVKFFVDGEQVGEDTDGPPYAVEWADENPFETRQIAVQVEDSLGETARDTLELKALTISDEGSVYGVRLEASVIDQRGRYVAGLQPSDFILMDGGQSQSLDSIAPDDLPQTYTLLIDSSRSMTKRMAFVREAARTLSGQLIRPTDSVIVAPFANSLGAITGPTKDHEVVTRAITAMTPAGGTAILDSLDEMVARLKDLPGPHVIVLVTDGYDGTSIQGLDKVIADIAVTKATVYVIAVTDDGIPEYGRRNLLRLANETGGLAFFPKRDRELPAVHGLITSDVQQRYVLAYTPADQTANGAWHPITLKTKNSDHVVQVRAGYFAPDPPPITPSIELTIRDTNRQYVDIGPEDLVVYEDGVEQKIDAFQEALTPVSLILALDASGSMLKATEAVIEAARTFIKALPPKDSLAMMQFADEVAVTQDFSTNRDAALDAVKLYIANGGTALYDALGESMVRLKDIKGRRAVVVLTDGRDENNPGTAPGSLRTLDDVLADAKTVGAAVFGIALGPRVDRDPLEQLAKMTGGETYYPSDVTELEGEYKRILENLQRRYIVRYSSTNLARNGKWRKVEIKPRQPGLVVESKNGYYAPSSIGGGSPAPR
jgi:VWFA-related protein